MARSSRHGDDRRVVAHEHHLARGLVPSDVRQLADVVVARLADLVLPGGRVFFAAEPIYEEGNPFVPYPWGLRMDGLSLISTRRWGWMELGFTRSYFYELLRRAGWAVEHSTLGYTHWADIYTARRSSEVDLAPPRGSPGRDAASAPVYPNGWAVKAIDFAAMSAKCLVAEGWRVFLRKAVARTSGAWRRRREAARPGRS
jgi:hypothetical protein